MSNLVLKSITKEFITGAETLSVLQDVNLQMWAGDNLAILGPSGSGKSTLLHIVGTLDWPTSGTLTIDGQDPFLLDEDELADFRNQQIGFIFQDHHLLPQLNVLENTLVPALAGGKPSPMIVDRATSLLNRVGLGERLDHWPSQLSGGERERVAVARALLNSPSILLADEPTGNLDAATAETVANLLLELQAEEQAVLIVVTHNEKLAGRFNRQVRLESGQLVEASELA